MSISPVGNSDAYARYRQQQLDLLAGPGRASTNAQQTTNPSYVTPAATSDDASSNSYATKFTADLSALNKTRGAHGHHHHGAQANAATDTTDSPTGAATTAAPTDSAFSQALDEFVNLAKTATSIAAVVV